LLVIRQMTPMVWLLFISAIISIVGLIFYLFKEKFSSKIKQVLLSLSQEIALILQAYILLLALFFLPIILTILVKGVMEIEFLWVWRIFIETRGLALISFLFFSLLGLLTLGFFL